MKISEYYKAHGLQGILRGAQTGTELHFAFGQGETRATVNLDVGGHSVEGYLELQRRHGVPEDEEFDMTVALRFGPRPDADYAPKPEAVLGNKSKVSAPVDPRFEPGPAPDLNPIPKPRAIASPVEPVDGFDPGPGPALDVIEGARVFGKTAEDEDDEEGSSEVERSMRGEFEAKEAVKEAKQEAKERGGKEKKSKVRP